MRTIFYSWMSDLPNSTNRGFIEKALRKAVAELAREGEIDVEARVDADTAGVPGSPDVANTILKKIRRADVFVGDVSIIPNKDEAARPTPNPNVLFELGYALHALGEENVVMVFNTASGEPKTTLPFDLGLKRAVLYAARPDDEDRTSARAELVGKLKAALQAVLDSEETAAASGWLSSLVSTLIDLQIGLDDFDKRLDGWWHESTFSDASTELATLARAPEAREREKIEQLAEVCDDIAVEVRRKTYSNIKQLLADAGALANGIDADLVAGVRLGEDLVAQIVGELRGAATQAADLQRRAEKMIQTGRYRDLRDQSAGVAKAIRKMTYFKVPLPTNEADDLRGFVQQLSLVDDGQIEADGGRRARELVELLGRTARELPRFADAIEKASK